MGRRSGHGPRGHRHASRAQRDASRSGALEQRQPDPHTELDRRARASTEAFSGPPPPVSSRDLPPTSRDLSTVALPDPQPIEVAAAPEGPPETTADPSMIEQPQPQPEVASLDLNGPGVRLNGHPVESGCTAPQLRRFIKSRAYVPMHELRRRFNLNGAEDDVSGVEVEGTRIYVGLPARETRLLGDLLRQGDVGYELSVDPVSPVVIGVYPMRPVPRA